jgi:GNAT superfamily N-acetyltransferase
MSIENINDVAIQPTAGLNGRSQISVETIEAKAMQTNITEQTMNDMIIDLIAIEIEPFDGSLAQYEACAALQNLVWPEYPETVADWQRWDAKRNPEHLFQRFIGRIPTTGEIVAIGTVMHTSWAFHPRRFFMGLDVHPDYQGRGIGTAIYRHMEQFLLPYNPMSIDVGTKEDRASGVRFIQNRGFELKTRERTSCLDLAKFEPDQFANVVHSVRASGIRMTDLDELLASDPDVARKLYELVCELEQDIPYHHEFTPPTFDLWLKRFRDNPNRINKAFIVALDGDQYVGLTMLFKSEASDEALFTGFTGVRRTHRRRGIAIALKVRALGYAKDSFRTSEGKPLIVHTENEENNPMFLINVKLGFERQPDFMAFMKTLDSDEADNDYDA